MRRRRRSSSPGRGRCCPPGCGTCSGVRSVPGTAVASSSRGSVSLAAKYSSPDSLLRPWQEKCTSRVSSRRRSLKKAWMRRLVMWAGSLRMTSTSKSPISGSCRTSARAAASCAGALQFLQPPVVVTVVGDDQRVPGFRHGGAPAVEWRRTKISKASETCSSVASETSRTSSSNCRRSDGRASWHRPSQPRSTVTTCSGRLPSCPGRPAGSRSRRRPRHVLRAESPRRNGRHVVHVELKQFFAQVAGQLRHAFGFGSLLGEEDHQLLLHRLSPFARASRGGVSEPVQWLHVGMYIFRPSPRRGKSAACVRSARVQRHQMLPPRRPDLVVVDLVGVEGGAAHHGVVLVAWPVAFQPVTVSSSPSRPTATR